MNDTDLDALMVYLFLAYNVIVFGLGVWAGVVFS